jgi:hypothetical protein
MRRINQMQSQSLSSLLHTLEPGALLTQKGFKSTDKAWPHVFQDFWAHASEQSFKELNKSISNPKTDSTPASKNTALEVGETPSLI